MIRLPCRSANSCRRQRLSITSCSAIAGNSLRRLREKLLLVSISIGWHYALKAIYTKVSMNRIREAMRSLDHATERTIRGELMEDSGVIPPTLGEIPNKSTGFGSRTPVITDKDRARVDLYLQMADFQPSSRALSAPCSAPQADWHGNALGAEQAALSREFSHVHGRGEGGLYSVPVSNGTRAISLTLTALAAHAQRFGLRRPRPGDNVIVPALTWAATATAPLDQGFVPRLADVDERTLCLDPASVRKLIDRRTFAIIAVHLYNRMADLDALAAIAEEHQIALIEDCAHAHGSFYHGRPAGTTGHAGTFSLQASKTLTCGEGGIVTTRHRLLAEQVASLANCGRPCGEATRIPSGNDRLPGLSAAFARAQLAEFETQQAARIAQWARLDDVAADLPGVQPLPTQPNTVSPTYKWAARYSLEEWDGMTLDEIAAALSAELDVEVARVYEPLTDSSLYQPMNHPLAVNAHSVNELDPARYSCPAASELHKTVLVIEHAAALRPDFANAYSAAVAKVRKCRKGDPQKSPIPLY
ncbi:DegT/DnrJ/EryC1/StrS family aminotransferase [Micromonospora vinacea]|uniref:DegT/DnrJ/EryC1/StrS family aminotransferase n=1 Tax=Micromonospora vinacea TaxID=709878 RepID=UPI00344B1C08